MIGTKMQSAMNDQIRYELESAYLYLAMAADFHAKSLDGMAQWMRYQAQEELGHALRFFNYIDERGGRIELQAVGAPRKEWSSPLEAFAAAHEHERFITGRIDELVKIAEDENDNAAKIMLQWFVTEQVEEESSVLKVVDLLKMIGDSGHGLMLVDRELRQRPAPASPGGATPAAE